jgi:hypothetical protein
MNVPNRASSGRIRPKINLELVAVCLFALVLSGCFKATNKFYLDSDIITDKRLEGHFEPHPTTHATNQAQSLVIKLNPNKHYVATYQENDHWIELDAVLFKSGTNYFIDISHIADNGTHNEPAVGPSGLEMLHLATLDKTHSAIRVRFYDDGVGFEYGYGNPVFAAIQKEPSLKVKVDEGQAILLDSTENLRSFLAKVGSVDSIFQNKARFTKIGK